MQGTEPVDSRMQFEPLITKNKILRGLIVYVFHGGVIKRRRSFPLLIFIRVRGKSGGFSDFSLMELHFI